MSHVFSGEHDGHDLRAYTAALMKNQLALVPCAAAPAGLFLAIGAAAVSCRRNGQYERRVAHLPLHPLDPVLRREAFSLVQDGVDAVAAQAVGEGEHAGLVLGRIAAVADEGLAGLHATVILHARK